MKHKFQKLNYMARNQKRVYRCAVCLEVTLHPVNKGCSGIADPHRKANVEIQKFKNKIFIEELITQKS